MSSYRLELPPDLAAILRSLAPERQRLLKSALRTLSGDPNQGDLLLGALAGLRKVRVGRFRIVYRVEKRSRVIRILAIGHRRRVYEELAERLRR